MLSALSPIWLTKGETARRVRKRIATVLDWAKAAGHRSGDNPVEGVERGLPKQGEREEHYAALPYAKVPSFVAHLQSSDQGEIARLAFKLLILTAAPTSEVLRAEWCEIDEAQALWIVPATRMKAGREHRVPLGERSLKIVRRAKMLPGDSAFIFHGRSTGKPMSNMIFLTALRRMKPTITAHGFRSSFRDWAAEATNLPREVFEMALAHTIENRVEAAYRRGDLLEKRRALMAEWATFCGTAERPRASEAG